MDNITKSYLLRTEGINGLRIIKRDEIKLRPRESVEREVREQKSKEFKPVRFGYEVGQLSRSYGVENSEYGPLEDWMVSGTARPPLVVRRVESKIKGMKKYALIDMRDIYIAKEKKQRPFSKKSEEACANVSYVYSEGIDFMRMVEDEKYAEEVMKLLSEGNLIQKREQSEKCDSDVVYIGTPEKTEQRRYEEIVKGIESELERQREAEEKTRQNALQVREKEIRREEAESFAETANKEQIRLVMEAAIRKFGPEPFKEILKSAIATVSEEKATQKNAGPGVSDDDEEPSL